MVESGHTPFSRFLYVYIFKKMVFINLLRFGDFHSSHYKNSRLRAPRNSPRNHLFYCNKLKIVQWQLGWVIFCLLSLYKNFTRYI